MRRDYPPAIATPAASYITGQVIVADGGVTIAGG